MDYEKAYNEALKRAKAAIASTIFPELRESEDERIRKGLLGIFKQSQNGNWGGMEIKDIVAYLERQKEPKPEWSEKDEKKLDMVKDALHLYWSINTSTMLIDWVKDLPNRFSPHWKPSEEQINAIKKAWITCNDDEACKQLALLWNDLHDLQTKL